MREVHVTVPELAMLVGTRAALGAGLGLLLADGLPANQRKAIGVDASPGRRRHHRASRIRGARKGSRFDAGLVAVGEEMT
jgi:hypothetical protein